MALECRGHPILSLGEFKELSDHLHDDGLPNSGALQAWYFGEAIGPEALHAALVIDAGTIADDRGHELIDLAIQRLVRAFPELDFDLGVDS